MTFEYKMVQSEEEQDIEELKTVLTLLEENHKIELAKETPNEVVISTYETKIVNLRAQYEALGGTYE